MSRQELSYFDIVPQWQTSVQSQQETGVSESPDSTTIIKVTDEYDADSDSESSIPIIDRKLVVPVKRRQALKDKRITQDEMKKLENRLNRTTVLCTSLFCINIAISGAMLLRFMNKL
ncbi:hypothetical protein H9Q69_007473 [Fusarium xylarioides]|uniref:Uncharacterized protein n=1 Tax=Fusarium xylarioides TaxID=221167 RepID=A0A9P7I852_9HYPO|nr:hypothetical protein H9Q70_011871 [Fusarium xylarioides]KAG5760408.1 hypothetical protein H9Q72_011481 [Fusarium xylarioides]KAG5774813.1 hypothetical protein H9Q73_011514 [Fusarium xylarioides]KAG5793500.1 hypothetical protein H9Q69_007473 [Fusarium xylarioides]KAG5802859.1 hypothetical protein H9Q71_012556 [Fusarium xylarioides]